MAPLDRFQEENSLLQQEEHNKEQWMISGHKNNILIFIPTPRSSPMGTVYMYLLFFYMSLKQQKELHDCNKHTSTHA